jgi:peroxiredoxin
VDAFLADHGVTGVSFIKDEKDDAFVRGLNESWTGAVPATFVFDRTGRQADFWEGKATYEELLSRVLPYLNTD